MSWEEMSTSQAVCPCGKGYITQKHYGDDWNRFKDGPVTHILKKHSRMEQ